MKPKQLINEFKESIGGYLGHYSSNSTEYQPRNAISITISGSTSTSQTQGIAREQAIIAIQSLFATPIPLLPNRDSSADETDQILSVLGQEHPALILDCTESWPDNTLGAAAGCIEAPGVLFILMSDVPGTFAQASPYETHLKREFRRVMSQDPKLQFVRSIYPLGSRTALCPTQIAEMEKERARGLEQQQTLVQTLHRRCLTKESTSDLLLARRGRGKSAALGFLIKRIEQSIAGDATDLITLTSPHRKQVNTVLAHADSATLSHTPLQVALQATGDVLIVDEAGSVPLPVLNALRDKYTHTIFAGTVDGYEGSGRALAIRLANKQPNQGASLPDIQLHTLLQPLRWPPNDPVESMVQRCLRLGIPEPSTVEKATDSIRMNEVHHQIVTSEQLLQDTHLLDEVFGLLLQAHYQTTSKDLKHLLNQNRLTLWTQRYLGTLTGACIIALEGGLSQELRTGIANGNRRPAHQKLPMLLYRQCQLDRVLQAHHWRIVRVAIKPAYQRKGLGQHFLAALHQQAINSASSEKAACSYLGASFGANDESYRFWHKAGFKAIHWGFKVNPRSGQRALTVMKPIHNDEAVERAHNHLIDNGRTLRTLCQLETHWLGIVYDKNIHHDPLISTLNQSTKSDPLVNRSDDEYRLSLLHNNQLGLHDLWGPIARSLGGADRLARLDVGHGMNTKQLTELFKALI